MNSQCSRRKVAARPDEYWVFNVSKANDLHYPAMEWENVKMIARLMNLQPCLYFEFHHPFFDGFRLCTLRSAAGVVPESIALGPTATETEAGLNHCSLTEQTVYSAEGGGDTWINIMSGRRSVSLGSEWPVNKTMGKNSQWLSFSSPSPSRRHRSPQTFVAKRGSKCFKVKVLPSRQSWQLYLPINHTISHAAQILSASEGDINLIKENILKASIVNIKWHSNCQLETVKLHWWEDEWGI